MHAYQNEQYVSDYFRSCVYMYIFAHFKQLCQCACLHIDFCLFIMLINTLIMQPVTFRKFEDIYKQLCLHGSNHIVTYQGVPCVNRVQVRAKVISLDIARTLKLWQRFCLIKTKDLSNSCKKDRCKGRTRAQILCFDQRERVTSAFFYQRAYAWL